MKEARFFEKEDETKRVTCSLCPHRCHIEEGKTGKCRVRKNVGGTLYALTYGKISSIALDPLEKKPLYHFYPGRKILSIGSVGCNFECPFCQNWQISQVGVEGFPLRDVTPEALLEIARREGSIGISFTYNEPFIWWEFVYDIALCFRKAGLKNVLVTNGYVEREPLEELLPLIDAMNIDLKSIDESFYRRYCRGRLSPVLTTIEVSWKAGVHVELTHLVVTGLNDTLEGIQQLVDWVATLSPSIPLHISRYFPAYELAHPPTPIPFLEEAFAVARKKLPFVYLGNVWDERKNSTFCPSCGNVVVIRQGYDVRITGLDGSRCRFCGTNLPFVVS
ncbi:MAG: AmmeMemoRadiSam system radical SAM enzyme [Candidatus Caldatribacterium sp.]|uniref:AmmeMemoRadiSam system radical SAM enzyme n=1 Tax=Candidatus Caldatribacterium sp. TaxID=2282143 RepID=UPI002998219D|nr:AmmeMemoRadiSam system radical SAM enzyme [Candidatus Caldatribacterium sp.]MCX7730040.1 AmmeMemoRadiSam system radical SAM enzyme [Candidatus Caldatribacterium sp.]MDW8080688.1 AmmeMemoRadiSam system radical SAM enzyme [Candidatus Calescibacterium sp.]